MNKQTRNILIFVGLFLGITLIWNGCVTRKQYKIEKTKTSQEQKEVPKWTNVGKNPKISHKLHDTEVTLSAGTYKVEFPTAIYFQNLRPKGYDFDGDGKAVLQYKKNGKWYDFVGDKVEGIARSDFQIRLKKDTELWVKFRYKTEYQSNILTWYSPDKSSDIREIFRKID